MTTETKKETLGFQTEAKQLLHLMIHSLYSNKEVFLRELISNASDAADKLRFEALSNGDLYENDSELKVIVEFDRVEKTITVKDNGIGMSRDEVVANLGTIAKSGTAQFLESMTGDEKKDAQLIGQFGVGFYSAFIVADKVVVHTRKAGTDASEGVRWESTGEADFSIESINREERGTEIVLYLKDGLSEYTEGYRLKNIIKKYADHISIPVLMAKPPPPPKPKAEDSKDSDDDDDEEEDVVDQVDAAAESADSTTEEDVEENEAEEDKGPEYETVNQAKALWTRSRTDVSDDQYKEFYKHISNDYEDPFSWSHNKVEGKLEYNSLLYVPKRAPHDMWNRDAARGLKLYVQRVFIMDDAEQFMPLYLRFVKGVIDSNDLPLNVSREILQNNPSIESMKSALTKRVLDMLLKLKKKDSVDYEDFWKQFGQVIKEGPAEDSTNKDKIAKLLLFASTHIDEEKQSVSLDDYISRMKDGQDKIYYISADGYNTAKNSPHLEVFRKKGIEVIILFDRVDEWMMSNLHEYEEKKFQDVARGELDLGKLADDDSDEDKEEDEETTAENKDFCDRFKESLGDLVKDVRVTDRLTESPACLVMGDYDMGFQMQQIMAASGQMVPNSKPVLEINREHPLIQKIDQVADEDRFKDLSKVIFDQATLAEGRQLDDPASYVQRLNKLLTDMAQ